MCKCICHWREGILECKCCPLALSPVVQLTIEFAGRKLTGGVLATATLIEDNEANILRYAEQMIRKFFMEYADASHLS